MSCGCAPAPSPCCTPAQQYGIENFGLAFPSLVGPAGPPGGPGTYVEDFDALRALDVTQFPDGYIANVAGYSDINDGGGGLFVYESTSVLADNDGTILSPLSAIGRWIRLGTPGFVNVKWFGAKGDGVTDDFAAIQAAIDVVEAAAVGIIYNTSAVLSFTPGLYLVSQMLTFDANFVKIEGNKAMVRASAAMSAVLQIGDAVGGAVIEMLQLNNLLLDGNNAANNVLWIREGHAMAFNQVQASNGLVSGIFVDGSGNGGNIGLYAVTFNECQVVDSALGFYFNKGGNTAAYECFLMNGCTVETGTDLISVVGNTFRVGINGGTFQNGSVCGLRVNGTAQVALDGGAYIENAGVITSIILEGGAKVSAESGVEIVNPVTYTSGTIWTDTGVRTNGLGPLLTPGMTGSVISDRTTWGSPIWPTGVVGSINQKGMRWTDKYGIEWVCTTSGTSSLSRWMPMHGRIIVPIAFGDIANGVFVYFPNEDFVFTNILFFVKTTFVAAGAGVLNFGTIGATQENWISTAQGAEANLVAGAVIAASANAHGTAVLAGDPKGYFIAAQGGDSGAATTGVIMYSSGGPWTDGLGYMLIEGFSTKFD